MGKKREVHQKRDRERRERERRMMPMVGVDRRCGDGMRGEKGGEMRGERGQRREWGERHDEGN